MANVAHLLCAAALSAFLFGGLAACGKSEPQGGPSPTSSGAPAPTSTVRLVVSRGGARLGILEIPPAKPVALTLETEGADATKLRDLAGEINAGDTFQVKMHLPSKEGERGPLGARIYRRGDADYAAGVEYKLLDEGYEVKRLE